MNIGELEQILQLIEEGAYIVDNDWRIRFWNAAATRITGYSLGEIENLRCSDNILRHVDASGVELCVYGCPLHATIDDGITRRMSAYLHHKDGHRLPTNVRSFQVRDDEGRVMGALEIFSDGVDRGKLLRELEQLRNEVLEDRQTSIGNRRYLEIVSENSLRGLRASGQPFGLLFIDIDHFKRVNDTYGHAAGDRTLRMVAQTIKGAVRPLDEVARYGGEEFVVICPRCDEHDLSVVAERIRALVEMTWLDYEQHKGIRVTVSIGGSIASVDEAFESIVERADSRMYECKESGRNRVKVGA